VGPGLRGCMILVSEVETISPGLDCDDRWRPWMAINNIRFYYGFEI